jgi:hypothetical protein
LVASAQESRELRKALGEGFAIVTPGVRPAGDQARVVTPKDAIAAGATYLVVGRPILEAPDPAKAAQQIADEIEATYRQGAERVLLARLLKHSCGLRLEGARLHRLRKNDVYFLVEAPAGCPTLLARFWREGGLQLLRASDFEI